MKNLLFTLLIILISTAVSAQSNSEVIRLSEPVQATESYEVFGAELDVESLEPISLAEIINGEEAEKITLVTSVSEVCAKKVVFLLHRMETLLPGSRLKIMAFSYLQTLRAKK